MPFSRRDVLLGLGGTLSVAALPVRASMTTVRQFRVIRGSDDIGTQTLSVVRGPDGTAVEISIDIRVKVLGITAYRYTMENRELWRDGVLRSLTSRTNDDGKKDFADIRREGDRLLCTGSGHEGELPVDAGTTSYWNPVLLRRPVWISTQTGRPLNVATRRSGTESLFIGSTRSPTMTWAVTGDLDIQLFFADDEWVGTRFDARGDTGMLVATGTAPPLAPFYNT